MATTRLQKKSKIRRKIHRLGKKGLRKSTIKIKSRDLQCTRQREWLEEGSAPTSRSCSYSYSLLLLLLLVLFLILLFIFLFLLCESRLSTRQSKVDGTLASGSLAIMLSLHAPRRQTSGVRSCANPPPLATARHRQPNWQRPNGTRSRRSAPLFSMSPNRAILSERSNFYGAC